MKFLIVLLTFISLTNISYTQVTTGGNNFNLRIINKRVELTMLSLANNFIEQMQKCSPGSSRLHKNVVDIYQAHIIGAEEKKSEYCAEDSYIACMQKSQELLTDLTNLSKDKIYAVTYLQKEYKIKNSQAIKIVDFYLSFATLPLEKAESNK